MSAAASDVLSRVRILEVWSALGGGELRHGRGCGFWRGSKDYNISLNDNRGIWHDFAAGEGGGILDLVVRVRGGSRADALHWCADLAGIPLEDKPLSAADRARWAAERRELERDLPAARYWRRAAVSLGEDVLDGLKAALVDPTLPQPAIGELANLTQQIAHWRRMDGAELVAEYRWWCEHYPGMAAAMVRAARGREQAERAAVAAYLRMTAARRQVV